MTWLTKPRPCSPPQRTVFLLSLCQWMRVTEWTRSTFPPLVTNRIESSWKEDSRPTTFSSTDSSPRISKRDLQFVYVIVIAISGRVSVCSTFFLGKFNEKGNDDLRARNDQNWIFSPSSSLKPRFSRAFIVVRFVLIWKRIIHLSKGG